MTCLMQASLLTADWFTHKRKFLVVALPMLVGVFASSSSLLNELVDELVLQFE